jgi:hypothetical protein
VIGVSQSPQMAQPYQNNPIYVVCRTCWATFNVPSSVTQVKCLKCQSIINIQRHGYQQPPQNPLSLVKEVASVPQIAKESKREKKGESTKKTEKKGEQKKKRPDLPKTMGELEQEVERLEQQLSQLTDKTRPTTVNTYLTRTVKALKTIFQVSTQFKQGWKKAAEHVRGDGEGSGSSITNNLKKFTLLVAGIDKAQELKGLHKEEVELQLQNWGKWEEELGRRCRTVQPKHLNDLLWKTPEEMKEMKVSWSALIQQVMQSVGAEHRGNFRLDDLFRSKQKRVKQSKERASDLADPCAHDRKAESCKGALCFYKGIAPHTEGGSKVRVLRVVTRKGGELNRKFCCEFGNGGVCQRGRRCRMEHLWVGTTLQSNNVCLLALLGLQCEYSEQRSYNRGLRHEEQICESYARGCCVEKEECVKIHVVKRGEQTVRQWTVAADFPLAMLRCGGVSRGRCESHELNIDEYARFNNPPKQVFNLMEEGGIDKFQNLMREPTAEPRSVKRTSTTRWGANESLNRSGQRDRRSRSRSRSRREPDRRVDRSRSRSRSRRESRRRATRSRSRSRSRRESRRRAARSRSRSRSRRESKRRGDRSRSRSRSRRESKRGGDRSRSRSQCRGDREESEKDERGSRSKERSSNQHKPRNEKLTIVREAQVRRVMADFQGHEGKVQPKYTGPCGFTVGDSAAGIRAQLKELCEVSWKVNGEVFVPPCQLSEEDFTKFLEWARERVGKRKVGAIKEEDYEIEKIERQVYTGQEEEELEGVENWEGLFPFLVSAMKEPYVYVGQKGERPASLKPAELSLELLQHNIDKLCLRCVGDENLDTVELAGQTVYESWVAQHPFGFRRLCKMCEECQDATLSGM